MKKTYSASVDPGPLFCCSPPAGSGGARRKRTLIDDKHCNWYEVFVYSYRYDSGR